MGSRDNFLLLLFSIVSTVHCNSEGDALNVWRTLLTDPNNALETWDPTLPNPCTWHSITCNSENNVVRVDVENQGLSGPIGPQLGALVNLEYLEVSNNNLSGSIPSELGNLTSLISLDLQHNLLNGSIPSTLGKLTSLRTLRLNSNQLTGKIPPEITQLKTSGSLTVMDVSDNHLEETVDVVQATPNNAAGTSNKRALRCVLAVGFGTILAFLLYNMYMYCTYVHKGYIETEKIGIAIIKQLSKDNPNFLV